jgi:S1-C subfamily serine protease
MPKENKCASKHSSETKSDESEVCFKVQCEKKCEQHCCIKECPCLKPEELVCLKRDAVVEIHSEFILLGESGSGELAAPLTSATGGTPLGAGTRADVILEGNGFFIKGHYIICPAHLILLPPSLGSVVNRFPLISTTSTDDIELGRMKDLIVRASRILVSVFNVNGHGHSFVYEADLVGVDGAGDIAVLRINFKKQWNFCNPCIEKCHPFLKFGKSRAAKEGEKVFLLGDFTSDVQQSRFNAVGLVTEGVLSDHRHLEYQGFVFPELVVVDVSVYANSSGLPILNCQGEVIGMQTTNVAGISPFTVFPTTQVEVDGTVTFGTAGATASVGSSGTIGPLVLGNELGLGFVAGPSEFFMRRVIKIIIKGTCSRKFQCQLETICDAAGGYYRYRKGYLGLAYDVFSGVDYDVTTDFNSGDAFAGQRRVRLGPNGEFLNSPGCKELIGLRVLGLAGINPSQLSGVQNGFYFVPGGSASAPFPSFLPISPLLGKLQPGDQITHFDGVALGDLNKQIAPSLITWRLCADDQLEITYRRGGNAANNSDNAFTENYDNLFTHTVCLADFPNFMDYPWYAVPVFPLLAGFGFGPAFAAIDQLANPQIPQRASVALNGDSIFHAAL